MDAKQLQELAERLLLGEYTTQDLHDAARCAKAWAKVMKALEATRDVTLYGADYGDGKRWTWWIDDDNPIRAASPIEAIEAAPEVKP